MPAAQQPQQRRGSGQSIDNWDDVPESGPGLTPGSYLVTIVSIIEATTNNGKACWIATFKVLPHAATKRHTGKTQKVWCVTGSDEDPMATDPQTFKDSIGAGILRRIFTKAKVIAKKGAGGGKIAVFAKEAKDKRLVIAGAMKKDNQGTNRFNVNDYFEVGEREPEMQEPGMDDATAPARSARRAPAPAADEPEAEEEALASDDSAESVSDDDAGAEEAAPEEEEAPPPAAKGKVTPIKKGATAAQPAAKVKCGMCGKDIARTEYRDHVETCEG
jgi:hypothetical protein